MHRFGYLFGLLLGFALTVGIPIGVFFALRTAWQGLNGANPNLAIALITAATTIVVSTITVMVGRHYERKREIEAHFRATKLEMYEDFVKEFFGLFDGSGQEKDLTPFLREWQRKLVLKAGPNVLRFKARNGGGYLPSVDGTFYWTRQATTSVKSLALRAKL